MIATCACNIHVCAQHLVQSDAANVNNMDKANELYIIKQLTIELDVKIA